MKRREGGGGGSKRGGWWRREEKEKKLQKRKEKREEESGARKEEERGGGVLRVCCWWKSRREMTDSDGLGLFRLIENFFIISVDKISARVSELCSLIFLIQIMSRWYPLSVSMMQVWWKYNWFVMCRNLPAKMVLLHQCQFITLTMNWIYFTAASKEQNQCLDGRWAKLGVRLNILCTFAWKVRRVRGDAMMFQVRWLPLRAITSRQDIYIWFIYS